MFLNIHISIYLILKQAKMIFKKKLWLLCLISMVVIGVSCVEKKTQPKRPNKAQPRAVKQTNGAVNTSWKSETVAIQTGKAGDVRYWRDLKDKLDLSTKQIQSLQNLEIAKRKSMKNAKTKAAKQAIQKKYKSDIKKIFKGDSYSKKIAFDASRSKKK